MRVLLFVCLCFCTGLLFGQTAKTNPQDSIVLANFNKEIQKYGWPSLWDVTKPVSAWRVVGLVGPAPYRVTSIDLAQNKFGNGSFTTETFPPCIEMLKDLPMLESFSTNIGLKEIPRGLGLLTQLKSLNLGYNKLESLSTAIYDLQNLEVLYIHDNKLTTLPSLTLLTKLKVLSVSNNQLTELPASLFTLTNLTYLEANDNAAVTVLPTVIKNLVNLETLELDRCALTTLPAELGQLSKLKSLHLNRNQLTVLPNTLGDLQSLEDLGLVGNQLTVLPATFSKLTRLTTINFSLNQITTFPASIVGLPDLFDIQADYNNMEGTLPAALLNKSTSQKITLRVAHNRLSGKFTISNPGNIRWLDISSNRYRFTDLSDVYTNLINNGATIDFNPQEKIGTRQTFHPANGDDLTLEIDDYTHLSGSVYTWRKLSSFNTPLAVTHEPRLTLSNINLFEDEDVYSCVVTHSALTGWELTSNNFNVIRKNKAPSIEVANPLVFRRNLTVPRLELSVYDDFTDGALIVWSVPSATGHFSFSESIILNDNTITITPLDLSWYGTDTLKVTATDEEGLSTTLSIPITMLTETNQPPVVSIPTIRVKQYPGSWTWQSVTNINSFIKDDYTRDVMLNVRIKDEAQINLMEKNIFVFADLGKDQWSLSFDHYNDNDTTFIIEVPVSVFDSEGGITETTVKFDLANLMTETPVIDPIPDQVMYLGEEMFPPLDLKAFLQNDVNDWEWSFFNVTNYATKTTVTVQGGIATAVPRSYRSVYTDTVFYLVSHRLNNKVNDVVKVIYHVELQQQPYVAGTVLDETGAPLKDVLLRGFPTEIRTDANGQFNVPVTNGWSGIITPSLDSYTFTPESEEVTNLLFPLEGLVFTAHKEIVTGIDDETNSYVRVYPNPIVKTFSVKIPARAVQPQVSGVNALGIPAQVQFLSRQQDVYQYELKDATPGIYLLSVNTGEHTEVKKVMVVSH